MEIQDIQLQELVTRITDLITVERIYLSQSEYRETSFETGKYSFLCNLQGGEPDLPI